MEKTEVPALVFRLLGVPARWADTSPTFYIGRWDGWDRTLEVFGIPTQRQIESLALIDQHEEEIQQAIGGPLVVIFRELKINKLPSTGMRQLDGVNCVDEADVNGPHRCFTEATDDDIYTDHFELQSDLAEAMRLANSISESLLFVWGSSNIDEDYKLAWEDNRYSKRALKDLTEQLEKLDALADGYPSRNRRKPETT